MPSEVPAEVPVADQFIDFAYRGPVEDRRVEALRPDEGAEWELQTIVAREPVWTAFRDEVVTPAGSELPAGSLCREYVLTRGEWSEPTDPTPCQTVPESGLVGMLACVVMIVAMVRRRERSRTPRTQGGHTMTIQ